MLVCIKNAASTCITVSAASGTFGGGVGAIGSSCDGGKGITRPGSARARRFFSVAVCEIRSLVAMASTAIGSKVE